MAGAQVIGAQAVEFAKRAGIAIYARAASARGRETVVRRDIPAEHHGVRAIVAERDVALVGFLGKAVTERFLQIVATAEERLVPIKELRFQCPEGPASWARGSFVVSTANLPDWPQARAALLAAGDGDLEIEDGLSALSLIGVGINNDTRNVTRATEIMRELGAPVLGLATSRFRISFITRDARLDEAVAAMHREFIELASAAPPQGD